MSRRAVGVAVTLALLTGGAIWFARGRPNADSNRGHGNTRMADAAGARPLAAVESAAATPARERDPVSNEDRSVDASEKGEDEVDDNRVQILDAVVVYTDAKGVVHLDANGEMTVVRDGREENPRERVEIANGRFHREVPGRHYDEIRELTLEHRVAFAEETDLRERDEKPYTLRAYSTRPTLVHVVDDASGAELAGIRLVDVDGEMTVVDGAASPIELDAPAGTDTTHRGVRLRVEPRGRTPQEIDVSYRWGGELFVATSRAAYLRVNVAGAPPDAVVGVFAPGDPPDGWTPTNDAKWLGWLEFGYGIESPTPIDGEALRAGRYLVAVVVGYPPQCSVPLVQQEIELRAGETTTVSLACRKVEHAAPVPIAGSVEVPLDWGDRPFRLEIGYAGPVEGLAANHRTIASEAMVCDEGSPRVFRWRDPGVEPGPYTWSIYELGIDGEWEIGPKGRQDLRIVAAAAGEVLLRLLDDATGKPFDESSVDWETEAGGAFRLGELPTSDGFAGPVPLGRGALRRPREWRVVESDPIEIHAGKNEFTLHVHRLPGVAFELRCEGRHVSWPWPDEGEWRFVPVDHDGELLDETWEEAESKCLLVSKPGRYRVQLPTILGFEPIPAFEVEIADGKPVVRTIELTHRR